MSGFDPFAQAANAKTRSAGMGGGFKPGYPLIQVHHVQTRDKKERANYQVRYGQDGKRWLDNNIWGVGAINSKKSESEQTEMFRDQIVSLFKSLVVKLDSGEYQTVFDYCKENNLGGGTSTWGAFADAICAEIAKLGGQGKVFLRIINRLRNPKITDLHVTAAKAKLPGWGTKDYYNGPTGYVLFEEWDKVEGKTPAPKKLPESFAQIDAVLKQESGGGAAGSAGSSGAGAPPPEDDEDIPF